MNRSRGRTEFVRTVLTTALPDTEDHLANLREGFENDDLEVVRRESHTLKGSSGLIGATKFSELALAIQLASEAEDLRKSEILFEKLESIWEKTRSEIEAFLEGL